MGKFFEWIEVIIGVDFWERKFDLNGFKIWVSLFLVILSLCFMVFLFICYGLCY